MAESLYKVQQGWLIGPGHFPFSMSQTQDDVMGTIKTSIVMALFYVFFLYHLNWGTKTYTGQVSSSSHLLTLTVMTMGSCNSLVFIISPDILHCFWRKQRVRLLVCVYSLNSWDTILIRPIKCNLCNRCDCVSHQNFEKLKFHSAFCIQSTPVRACCQLLILPHKSRQQQQQKQRS